ncbi:MAG: hydroxymethylglutaryl-CoA reductase [Candidatus Daviesbacteria bacterium]|nr:hydroxymethylglutaryl-CoA reductase [Candidatus Daviesbacteria bacterium]
MKNKISLRDFKNAQARRKFLEEQLNIKLDNISNFTFTEDQAVGRNIENLVGATQIPLGVAGPLRIHLEGVKAHLRGVFRDYYIPLATTEGALVASVSRGCKAINKAGGATVFVENVGITRGPVFKAKNLGEALRAEIWIEKNFKELAKIAESTSSHLKLLKAESRVVGRNLFVRFYFDTKDAMGMNMATFATEQAAKLIEQKTKVICVSLAGNFDIDKKPAWLNFINGRGKKVWAEIVLPEKIVADVLKTTPGKIVEVVERKCHLGGVMSGSLGFNAHFANIIAAVFTSTGQDLAHVVEGSLGVTSTEILENGDLSFSVYLPSLIAGTVGGGTHLPAQQEALGIMQVSDVLEYSQVLGGAVLAGELSLLASLAEGSLAKAHKKLGRKKAISLQLSD